MPTTTTTTPTTKGREAEVFEGGGLQRPLIDPVDVLAGGLVGPLRSGIARLSGAAPTAVRQMAPAAAQAPKFSVKLGPPIQEEGRNAVVHSLLHGDTPVGAVRVAFHDPKRTAAYISSIEPIAGSGVGPNILGPSTMRTLLKEFQEFHPNVKNISGLRISGVSTGGGRLVRLALPAFMAALGLNASKPPKHGRQ